MSLELRLNLKQTQTLVMTPQLQQAIKLLQLSRLELAETIQQELEQNPALEEAATLETPEELTAIEMRESGDGEQAETPEPTEISQAASAEAAADDGDFAGLGESPDQTLPAADEFMPVAEAEPPVSPTNSDAGDPSDEIDWREYLNQNFQSETFTPSRETESDEERPGFESVLTRPSDLADHLEEQLRLEFTDEVDERIGLEIIGNLDANGYLADDVPSIAARLDVTEEQVERVLLKIQRFDPIGVASRDLRECLLVQARIRMPEAAHLIAMIQDHLGDLERRRYKQIAKALGITPEDVIEELKTLHSLNPKPGRTYSGDSPRYITPDIYVHKVGEEFVVQLNDDGLPKLRVSSYYRQVLDRDSNAEARAYIKEKLKNAQWLIKSIEQRRRTIFKVTDSIVRFQREFLEHGVEHLRPMVLKDVADDIGMHESTVSRVTTNKYVHTPQGIFELKYFFNTSIQAVDGGDGFAAESVKEKIRQLIAGEDSERPHSDQRIVQILKDKHGMDIARRTVTKYREMLGLLSSAKRKRYT